MLGCCRVWVTVKCEGLSHVEDCHIFRAIKCWGAVKCRGIVECRWLSNVRGCHVARGLSNIGGSQIRGAVKYGELSMFVFFKFPMSFNQFFKKT